MQRFPKRVSKQTERGIVSFFRLSKGIFLIFSLWSDISGAAEKEGIRSQDGFFMEGRSILFRSSVMALYEKSRSLSGVEASEVRRMIQKGSLHGYRAAMEDLLNGPAYEFVRVISPQTARGGGKKSIYMEMSRLAIPEYNANSIKVPEFYQEALNLLIAVTPPLGKMDRNGIQAKDLAKARGNQPVFKTFYRQGRRVKSGFELDANDQESLWSRHISLVPLQETALAQAILAEDPDIFWKELENLMSGPAKDLLSVLHSRTSSGDSVFHLAAKVSSYKEEFAAGMEALITFIVPTTFYFSRDISPAEWTWRGFWDGMGAGSLMIGLPMTALHALYGSPETAYMFGAVAVAGITGSVCHAVFRRNKTAKNIIKSL